MPPARKGLRPWQIQSCKFHFGRSHPQQEEIIRRPRGGVGLGPEKRGLLMGGGQGVRDLKPKKAKRGS